jgi:hypothetical protein
MSQSAKKWAVSSILFGVVVLFILLPILIVKVFNSPIWLIERRWEIDIPNGSSVNYSLDEIGWFGEGERYTVISIKPAEATKFRDRYFHSDSYAFRASFSRTLALMNVSEKHLPNWNERHFVYSEGHLSDTHLAAIFFPDKNMLIVCEEFF